MNNFVYYTPTKVVFGKETEQQTGKLAREFGAEKVLLHYGSDRVKKNGLLGEIEKSLEEEGIAWIELGGVVPNPRLSKVYEGIELGRKEKIDFIIAVGGGSVVDSAKAIGYGIPYEGDVWDFFDKKAAPARVVPVGTVMTIAATGSEMSNSSVITKEEGWVKRGSNYDIGRPKFAVLDPLLTVSLPQYQTMCGCTDIMMHTLERYLSASGTMEITDSIGEALLRTVMKEATVLLTDPTNYDARAEVMWAGSLSHNGLTGCGTDGGDWACHRLEHELSGLYDVAHGAGLSAIWGTWARYVYRSCPSRFARLAVNVLGVQDTGDEEKTAAEGIDRMVAFFRSLHMPTSLTELGVHPTEEEYKILAHKCAVTTGNNLGSIRKLHEEDMEAIYRQAL